MSDQSNISINEISNIFGGEKEYIGQRIEPFQTLSDCSKIRSKLKWESKTFIKKWLEEQK